MKVLELIPSNILTKLLTNSELKFNKIEKVFLSKKLELKALSILNKFSKKNITTYEIEIDFLNDCPQLQITKEDLECVAYNLKPFGYEAAKEILTQFEIINELPLFLVVKELYPRYREKVSDKKKSIIIELMRILQQEDRIFKKVCEGKGMKDFYNEVVSKVIYDLDILRRYINALE